ncbi:MAG: multiheme c-type cytochrome [Planctomycetota bacterium]
MAQPGRNALTLGVCSITLLAAAAIADSESTTAGGSPLPLPGQPADFAGGGSTPGFAFDDPPGSLFDNIASGTQECIACHGGSEDPLTTIMPYRWRGSMHAHSARDPIFRACVTIANQDVANSGQTCYACHSPGAFFEGRVIGMPDGSGLTPLDVDEGVSCNVCHRAVDAVFDPVENPSEDATILSDPLVGAIARPGNMQFVIDPFDRRRGPFNDVDPPHAWLFSPHHSTGDMCATCHDLSNPIFDKQPDGSYRLNAFGAAHPTGDLYDMFPEQRTYSEWLNSAYAQGGVPADDPFDPYSLEGRFGDGTGGSVSTCQDCHMPDREGFGCIQVFDPPLRDNVPDHGFVGANIAALDLILYYDEHNLGTFALPGAVPLDDFTIDSIDRQKAEAAVMLQKATDLELSQQSCDLRARVINQCGHKLLTGFPEGTRIWVNVRFLDSGGSLIEERGAYDNATAELTAGDTKVYEIKKGLDSYMSGQTGIPEGASFHLLLNNVTLADNRIPPRGFTNAAYEAIQAEPIGAMYADGVHWDDTLYDIPAGAASAEVRVFYQTLTKEYVEFLRDANTTDSRGIDLYNAWAATGKAAPVEMDFLTIALSTGSPGDADGNGVTETADITFVVSNLGAGSPGAVGTPGDVDGNGMTQTADLTFVVSNLGAVGCN